MDITPLIPEGRQIIQSYSVNGFKVNGTRYTQALIVTPEETFMWTDKTNLDDLALNDFNNLLEQATQYDVFLFGTGSAAAFPDPSLLKSLRDRGLKPDIMDSGAACRTYNVLMAEDRRVAALLLPLTNAQ